MNSIKFTESFNVVDPTVFSCSKFSVCMFIWAEMKAEELEYFLIMTMNSLRRRGVGSDGPSAWVEEIETTTEPEPEQPPTAPTDTVMGTEPVQGGVPWLSIRTTLPQPDVNKVAEVKASEACQRRMMRTTDRRRQRRRAQEVNQFMKVTTQQPVSWRTKIKDVVTTVLCVIGMLSLLGNMAMAEGSPISTTVAGYDCTKPSTTWAISSEAACIMAKRALGPPTVATIMQTRLETRPSRWRCRIMVT